MAGLGIGSVTSRSKQRTALPWPSDPYAGSVPLPATPATTAFPTTPPNSVSDALRNTTSTLDLAKGSVSATQPFLDQYLKPNAAGTTPFRQALTNTKAGTTADAYDNAVARTREKAQSMGFASNPQPVTFGAEAGIANERAKAIADIPNQVNLEAQPVEFQAAQMQQNQAGIYNALANTQQGEAGILAQQKAASDAQKAALTSGLVGAGISAATPLLTKALHIGGAAAVGGTTAAGASGAAAGTATGAGASGAAGTTGAAGGGFTGALGALATNPVTWAVAGALTAAILWKKSQVHPTADNFVQTYQNPFGQHLGQVVDGFNQAYASGKLDKASATAAYNETAALIDQFKKDMNDFSQKGSKENRIAHQAAATMADNFGPNWEKVLGQMQQQIAGLPA